IQRFARLVWDVLREIWRLVMEAIDFIKKTALAVFELLEVAGSLLLEVVRTLGLQDVELLARGLLKRGFRLVVDVIEALGLGVTRFFKERLRVGLLLRGLKPAVFPGL